MVKSLRDISWQVDEPTYRADPALSYSLLAKYDREGFGAIPTLFDHIDTDSLRFGSMVDTLVTDGQEAYDSKYVTLPDDCSCGQKERDVVDVILRDNPGVTSLADVPSKAILKALEELSYQSRWRDDTRVKYFKERAEIYFVLKVANPDKTLVTVKDDSDAKACLRKLKYSDSTYYFFEGSPFESDEIERLYQLKFKGEGDGVAYRCMADLIVVDHTKKIIHPIDLKTTGHPEYMFFESFLKWGYAHQARLYWRIIKQNIEKDDYFKDFTLLDYDFVVINRNTLNPLVWHFEDTQKTGTLVYKNPYGEVAAKIRDPYDIGKELRGYIDCMATVPNGIVNGDGDANSIVSWITK